jgi:DNA-binding transcriptional LysR family regulator
MPFIMKTNVDLLSVPMLRALHTLIEESSVSRAAVVLGVSQPAMSMQLKRLREAFGDPILARSGAGSRPTGLALKVKAPVADVLRRIDLLAATRSDQTPPEAYDLTVNFASTDYAREIVTAHALARIREKAPGLRLNFMRSDRTRVREWMAQGSVDFGIGPIDVPSELMHVRRLYRDGPRCLVQAGLLRGRPLTLDLYCDLAHVRVMPALESYMDESIGRKLASLGRQRNVVVTVPDFLGVQEVVRHAPLTATVPSLLLKGKTLTGVEVHDLPFALPEGNAVLYWHDRTHKSAVHKWLRTLIAEAFRPRSS